MISQTALCRFATQLPPQKSLRATVVTRLYARFSLVMLALCFLFSADALAQNVQYTNKATDLGMRSTQKVNPITRAVEFQIPLGRYAGRAGHDVPVVLSYSSKLWEVEYQGYNPGPPPPHGGMQPFTIVTANYAKRTVAGWTSTVGFPILDFSPGNAIYDPSGNPNLSGNCTFGCYRIDRMMVWMPDGSGHELRTSDQPRLYTDPGQDNYYSVDGTRMRYQASTSTLFLPDGSQYQFATGKYVDRNGNTLSWVGGWRDTLDRTINNPLPYNVGQGPLSPTDQTYNLPGVGNTTLSYTLKWRNLGNVLTTPDTLRYTADSACPPGTGVYNPYLFQYDSVTRTCFGNGGVLFNPVVLSQIVLPNGQTYTFTYDIWGAIDKVLLPTGGYERYEYAYTGGISSPATFKWVYAQGNRGVTKHIVSPTGNSADEIETLYSGSGNFVSMTLPDGSRKENYVWTDGTAGWGYSADSSRAGLPYDERVYSASGQMLRRKLTQWVMTPSNATGNPSGTQNANRNARIAREVELILDTGGPALAKTRTYTYDTTYQYTVGVEQTAINEFDFVQVDQTTAQTLPIGSLSTIPNGTLLRTTEFDYLTSDSNYRSRNLLGQVTTTRIKNGAGTIVGQTSNSYDEAGFPLLTYASVIGWTDPATSYRGNVTSNTTWLNFNGSTLSSFPQGTYLAAHTQYDQCGSVRKTWDAKDATLTNPDQIEYSSTYHRAYPTTLTSADPDAAGSLTALVNTAEYDLSTGLITAKTDANAQRTTFAYNDPLNRLTQTVRASTDTSAKSQTTNVYNDASRTVTTTSDLTAYNDNLLKSVALYDALGRLMESQQHESASSYISTQQQYDNLGRVFKISNPFRPLQGETALWTTQQFDALGRLISLTTPDTAVFSTSYSGNASTVTDQIGKQRKSVSDSLGRTIQVYEAPNDPSFNYLTSYDYDALDNLVKITQGTQLRYFMYDSLKRLIRSRNPELDTHPSLNLTDPKTLNANWSTGYQYDQNNNLTQKTDPRGVLATYTYDALNRNLSISYSNDPSGTPAVTLAYDTATNGKGRLRQSQTANTSRTTIDAYDAIGRPLSRQQQFYVSGAWGPSYTTQRTYNRAGGVTSQTYPSTRVVNYDYDNAGRINSFTGNLGDNVTRTYSNEVIYSPFGGMAKEKFGTTMPIYNKLFYNNRGQLAEIRSSTTYTGPNDISADRGGIVNHYSEQCAGRCTPTSTMTDNNGNLRKQEILIPNQTTRLQRYEYDSLNRLTLSKEELSGVEQWKQQFTYDRWGNRLTNLGTTYGVAEKDFTANTGNNRLGVPVGQTGVMTYDATGNLTEDTYTGAGLRTYDAENRMISAWGGLNQMQTYGYDAAGSRIKRKVHNVETWQVYGFEGELVAEYAASGAATSPQKEYGYRNGQLLVSASAAPRINVAAAANGGTATASQTHSAPYSPSGAINGDRKFYLNNNAWSNSTATFPQWLQVDFNGSKVIDEIDVFSVQDVYTTPSEPTPTLTFSTYGLTAFEAQYWNGSAWVAVPGGTVTGNNKVWKQITFSPVTTTKIRIWITGSIDGYSRMTEVEAWGVPAGSGGSSGAGVQWLVSDQLGTPRIVLDLTGSQANVKRHDYLPFGEELVVPIGGRSVAQGYSGGDGVRQQFTSKERDTETGLDYFGARYYSSVQGRFTGVDPENAGAFISYPQSWNGYAYSLNNPLRFIDPDGLRWAQIAFDGGIQYRWFDDEKKDDNGQTEYDRALAAGYSAVTFDESKNFSFATGLFAPAEVVSTVTLRTDGAIIQSHHVVTLTEWLTVFYTLYYIEHVVMPESGSRSSDQILNELIASVIGAAPNVEFNPPEIPAPALTIKPKPTAALFTDVKEKVHGKLPKSVPKDWTREDMRESADALRRSLATRRAEARRLGEDGPHRRRINEEEKLLRQIMKKLSGS